MGIGAGRARDLVIISDPAQLLGCTRIMRGKRAFYSKFPNPGRHWWACQELNLRPRHYQ